MSLTAWRITKRRHAKTAFTGLGAKKYAGRWNSPGTAMVYTSQHQSLAVLELLVHIEQAEAIHNYVLISVEMQESLVTDVDQRAIPGNWREEPPPQSLRKIGDDWVRSGLSVALRVPSTIIPAENNFLLNPAHGDFEKLIIGKPMTFSFDPRLMKQKPLLSMI